MSQEPKPIRIAIGENLWTRALVDGSVRVDGFAVEFHSKVTLPDRLHGVREGKWQGSDGTLTDYLLEKDAGLGVPKVALPIFMLGGISPTDLAHAARWGCGGKSQGSKGAHAARADSRGRLCARLARRRVWHCA